MVLTVRHIKIIILIVFANPKLTVEHSDKSIGHHLINTTNPFDWRNFEAIAEEHPYIVAILSGMKDYICTGSVINKVCVLTSGNCLTHEPKYVAVNTAVYNKKLNNNTVFTITRTVLHADYIYQLVPGDPNLTRMHSNIALVYVDRPFLEYFINVADLGTFYASELKDKELTALGFGNLGSSNVVGLQYQMYEQTVCMNPRWYYCVCGSETNFTTYMSEFGKGGPILLGSSVVGVSAAPTGALVLRTLSMKYNVFTVVGPYLPWIEKNKQSSDHTPNFRSEGVNRQQSMFLKHFHILIMFSKMIF